MKKKILAAMLAALAVGAMALAGCSTGGNTTDVSSDNTEVISSEADVSSEESSIPDNVIVEPVVFEVKFAENPIDAAYDAESVDAVTTLAMSNLENKYAELWKAEIDHAYQQLFTHSGMEYMADDQKKWNNTLESELQLIRDSITDTGTIASLDYAIKVKQFYRDKAESLYEQLYTVDTDYTYAYTA